MQNFEAINIDCFARTISRIGACRTGPAKSAGALIACKNSLYTNLVTDFYLAHLVANEIVVRDQMIIRKLVHIERFPGRLVTGLHIAGKDAIPEIDLVELCATRIISPHHTNIEHVEMVIGKTMHTAILVMMPKRHDHANEVIVVFRINAIGNAIPHGFK